MTPWVTLESHSSQMSYCSLHPRTEHGPRCGRRHWGSEATV